MKALSRYHIELGKEEKTMPIKITFSDRELTFDKSVILGLVVKEFDPERKYKAAKINGAIAELTCKINEDANVELLDLTDTMACKMYEATLRFVVAMAFARTYPDLKIRFAYNVSRCISIHLLNPGAVASTAMLLKVRHEIDNIIAADYPIVRKVVSKEEARAVYNQRGYLDKLDILQFRPEKTVHLYECAEYTNYMYSKMLPSTGYLDNFKLRLYTPGFLLQYPRAECGGEIPLFKDAPTFNRALNESYAWSKTAVGSNKVASINAQIKQWGASDFINMCEARHNRMLCELGQTIEDSIDDISLICVAGPSSSGKTTFANRLRIELLSRGIRPIRISLDDYYLRDKDMPLNEEGKPDYEAIGALDLELFNQNMVDLINGEEVALPKFDFQLGHRVKGRELRIEKNQPIIIEGIHALNEQLAPDISNSKKFKIFIAPQAQLNLDDHTPLSLTDLRLIRRIVRDHQFRNSPVEETLSMWPDVRKGEFRWIYDTQEGSDYVFNSMLAYELPVMKKYALPLLREIPANSPYHLTATRLIRMLKFFVGIDDEWVPSNSLMREFIGGSCFEKTK